MPLLDLIKQLDSKTNNQRQAIIIECLEKLNVEYVKHKYSSGTNLIVKLGNSKKKIGVASHFDVVTNSGGANDNGSAITVCIDIIQKYKKLDDENIGLKIFFFDEEETGLKGSKAYVKDYGIEDLAGLINLELVGMGNQFALWPINDSDNAILLKTFETISINNKIDSKRFDQIVTNTADHVSFRNAGLLDAFTITCISDQDIEAAENYYKALASSKVDQYTLFEILSKAPIFQHYHQPTDTFEKLTEVSLARTSSIVWETILAFHKK